MFRPERSLRVQHRTWVTPLLPVEKQMLVVISLFALLAPLAAWELDNIRAVPLEPLGAFALGFILGMMTGVIYMMRQRWRR